MITPSLSSLYYLLISLAYFVGYDRKFAQKYLALISELIDWESIANFQSSPFFPNLNNIKAQILEDP